MDALIQKQQCLYGGLSSPRVQGFFPRGAGKLPLECRVSSLVVQESFPWSAAISLEVQSKNIRYFLDISLEVQCTLNEVSGYRHFRI
jgi:hypothetical protein